jgi:hypothetical protein
VLAPDFEEIRIGAGDHVLKGVGHLRPDDADGDGAVRVHRCQGRRDLVEARFGVGHAEGRHRAHEFVVAVADDNVVGAEVRAQGPAHQLQQRVAGQVTLAVVDLFEPVDVDEGKRKGRAGSMRPLSSRDISSRPNLRAQPPVSSSAAANFNASTPSAILARLGTVACCLLAVIDSPSTVIGSVRTVGRRPPPVTQRPRKDIFQACADVVLLIVQTRQLVTASALRSRTTAARSRPSPAFNRGRPGSPHAKPTPIAVEARLLARQGAALMGGWLTVGSEIIISSVLIRASLVVSPVRSARSDGVWP